MLGAQCEMDMRESGGKCAPCGGSGRSVMRWTVPIELNELLILGATCEQTSHHASAFGSLSPTQCRYDSSVRSRDPNVRSIFVLCLKCVSVAYDLPYIVPFLECHVSSTYRITCVMPHHVSRVPGQLSSRTAFRV